MSSLQYFVASSLDGFIATSDDNLAWLLEFDGFEGGRESYDAFMADVGCIVMGGETYAWLMEHEPGNWPYPDTPCWVFTHHEHSAPRGANVTFVRGDVREFMDDFTAEAGAGNVWLVGGGELAAQFADAGLLDELIISIIPVVLGAGKPVLPIGRSRCVRWNWWRPRPWAGESWSCGTGSAAHRRRVQPPRAQRRAEPSPQAAVRPPSGRDCQGQMSRIRLVMRAVDSRRPFSSVITISWVVRVLPRWMAVQVPVTVPAAMAR